MDDHVDGPDDEALRQALLMTPSVGASSRSFGGGTTPDADAARGEERNHRDGTPDEDGGDDDERHDMFAAETPVSVRSLFADASFFAQLRNESPSLLPLAPQLGEEEEQRRNARGDDDNNGDRSPYSSSSLSVVPLWNAFLRRHFTAILAVTVALVWPAGFASFFQFEKFTDSTAFHPTPGSPSAAAQAAFAEVYYAQEDDWLDPVHPPLVLVLEAAAAADDTATPSLVERDSPAFEAAQNFSLDLLEDLNSRCWTWPDERRRRKKHRGGNSTTDDDICQRDEWLKVTSYYSLLEEDLDWMARDAATKDGSIVLVQVEYRLPANKTRYHKARILDLMDAVDDYKQGHEVPQLFTVSYTGIKYFQSDLLLSTRRDIQRMDALVLPAALVLMGIVLPRANIWKVWIVPLFTMITTCSVWSIILRLVAWSDVLQISTFTPTVMMSLSLGMGIDYTMFLLARYLEDTSDTPRAVLRVLSSGGQVLLLSGLTLSAAFLGLFFLSLQMLQSIGVGSAVAIGSSLVVNLTVVPCLLYTRVGEWIVVPEKASEELPPGADSDDDVQDGEGGPPEVPQTRHVSQRSDRLDMITPPPPPPSLWYRLSRHLLHPLKGIIILLALCQMLLPVAFHATQIKSSISFDLLLPTTSPSLQMYHALGNKMGWGRLNPYRILFDARAANFTMTSSAGFAVMHRVLDELRAIDRLDATTTNVSQPSFFVANELSAPLSKIFEERKLSTADGVELKRRRPTTYSGVSVLHNVKVPYPVFLAAKACGLMKPHCSVEMLHVIDEIDDMATSRDADATFLTATLGSNPFSDEGISWLLSARRLIQNLEDQDALSGVNVYIEGTAGIANDAVHSVSDAFPFVATATVVVVFVLMGLFFRSLFAPLRSIVSIALTLSFSFGLAVYVYQDGIFNWMNLSSLNSIGNEVCWLVPVMAFSTVVGLTLDYDVFLVSRILEYRLDGYEHRTSIASGLHSTGGVINAAGVIMALAFGSLLLSSNPVLHQWSFIVTTAVLVDTFVVRTMVVPILTGLTGKHCWWPRRLPEGRICLTEYQEREGSDVAGLLRSLEATSEYEPLRSTHCE